MELEESLKWTEMQRARKLQQQQQPPPKKGGIWDLSVTLPLLYETSLFSFSGLFGESLSPTNQRRATSRAESRGKMTRSMEYIDPDTSVDSH